MEKLPITVLIPTLNAGDHLDELLDSVFDWVESVQVLDSRSIDDTVDIALSRGIPVVQRAFTTHGEHFQWMVDNMPVRTEWIFLMAQDERFTPSLISALGKALSSEKRFNGYTVRWRLWFMGKPLHVIIDNLRLMRVGHFRIADVICNEHILVDGPVGGLGGVLEHKDTLALHDWYEKQNLYSTLESIAHVEGRGQYAVEPSLWGGRLALRMLIKKIFFQIPFRYQLVIWYNFFVMGAWRDGRVGWIWSRLRSEVYRMNEYKVLEMQWTGHIPEMPKARHGDYDPRIMATALQQQLLPNIYRAWRDREINPHQK